MDKKRILILVAFLVFSSLMGYLLFRMFFAAPEPSAPVPVPGEPTEPTTEPAFPSSGSGRVPVTPPTGPGELPTSVPTGVTGGAAEQINEFVPRRVVTDNISNTRPAGNAVQFYNEQDGRYYRYDANGNLIPLSDEVFFNVENTYWSNDSDAAVIEYPDGNNVYYNFKTKEKNTLPRHWEDFSFSSDNNTIAAKSVSLSPENRWLVSSDTDGSRVKLIEPLGNNQDLVEVDWSPNRQVVGFARTGQALGDDREEILLVGQNGENFKSLVVEGRGFESKWSPTGEKIVYSVYSSRSNFKPEVWISGAQGDNIGAGRKPLGVNTWAEKCSFEDERFVYCAVPRELEVGVGFAPELANNSIDDLYKIDTITGVKTKIDLGGEDRTIEGLHISEDGDTLFFTDKQQRGLFQVSL